MKEDKLRELSKTFSQEISALCTELKNRRAKGHTINQLYRAGTSVYANVQEAHYARGRNDFGAKLHIALMECNESEGWLDLLLAEGNISKEEHKHFVSMCINICRIAGKSIRTSQENAITPDRRRQHKVRK